MSEQQVQEYHLHQIPDTTPWRYIPLYRDSYWWQIGFTGLELEMRHGKVEGVTTSAFTEVTTNTSGKTMFEQALLQARRRYKDKWDEGYRPLGVSPGLRKGMKGNEYEQGKTRLQFPVAAQLKLDGMRILSYFDETGNLSMRSYENKPQPHLTHLKEQVTGLLQYLPPGSTLDSELYLHREPFTSLMSICKSVKNIHPRLPEVELHMFDVDYTDPVNGPPTFDQRYSTLDQAFQLYSQDHGVPSNLRLVPVGVAKSSHEIEQLMESAILSGYEGLMLKKVGFANDGSRHPVGSKQWEESLYRYTKCNNILKYKWKHDEEMVITDVEEEVGTHKGCGKFVGNDPRGNTLKVVGPGNLEQRRYYLQNKHLFIGKKLTYKYVCLSEYGVARHATGKAIRDYE